MHTSPPAGAVGAHNLERAAASSNGRESCRTSDCVMRVLHVLPQFSPESINGSERYEYMLCKKLVELGVEVDLLTTITRDFLPVAPFCLQWPVQNAERVAERDGIRIKRFPVTFHLPAFLGHFVSQQIRDRWAREERRYGTMLKGSRNQIDYFHLRGIERPLIYDLMATLGRGPYSVGLLRNLITELRRCDVVQVGFTPFATAWQVVAMARLFRKPVVVLALFHPEDLSHHFRSIYWSFSVADAVLAQTPYSTTTLKRLLPASNPVTVGAGVDLEQLADAMVCGTRFRAKYHLHDKKLALFVGRKERFKRYDVAIQAVESIDDQRLHLVIIGRDVDRRSISSSRVTYLGEVSQEDLGDAYDACDVFVMPSENESFGIVFLEAWARRKPVIGNRRCAAVASLIEQGRDGFLCKGPSETATALTRLIADPVLAGRLGRCGYQKTVTSYTWDIIARRVNELYSGLVADRRSRRSRRLNQQPSCTPGA
jgi:glycosyltransferase involved in cell wall biosynthesis